MSIDCHVSGPSSAIRFRMILLIDIGNTRIKWSTFDREQLAPPEAAVHANWTEQECRAAFGTIERPERVFVSNVGGERIGGIVHDVALASWGIAPTFVQSSAEAAGVRNAYPDVWKLGVDRWLAMIAAYSIHRRAICVVGVGTAATIDGVDASGRHLGGLIIPGPDLMVDSLLKNTSGIAKRAESGAVGLGVFADNTLGAIRQGSVHAVAALAERAVESMRSQVGELPLLVFTGGSGEDVARFVHCPNELMPDLVLRGLSLIARIAPTSTPAVPRSG